MWILRGFYPGPSAGTSFKSLQATWKHFTVNSKTKLTPSEKVTLFKKLRYLQGIMNSSVPRTRKLRYWFNTVIIYVLLLPVYGNHATMSQN